MSAGVAGHISDPATSYTTKQPIVKVLDIGRVPRLEDAQEPPGRTSTIRWLSHGSDR